MCILKPGLRKAEKSSFNLIFFIVAHISIESTIFLFILPCNLFIIMLIFCLNYSSINNNLNLCVDYNSYAITYVFISLLILIFGIFGYLWVSKHGLSNNRLETRLSVIYFFRKLKNHPLGTCLKRSYYCKKILLLLQCIQKR